jgi:hypothetical protein
MEYPAQVMHESIRDYRPWFLDEISKRGRDGQLLVKEDEKTFCLKNERKYLQRSQSQEHHHVDDDELHVSIVIPVKSLFKLVQHSLYH